MLILAGCLRDPEGILSDSLSALQGFLQHFNLDSQRNCHWIPYRRFLEDFGGFLGIFRDF